MRKNIGKKWLDPFKKMFYSSDPGCYELVNKIQVSPDVEPGDPEFGYDEM